MPPNDHAFPRIIIDALVQLQSDAKKMLGVLLKNGKILDPYFVLLPMAQSSALPAWNQPQDVPPICLNSVAMSLSAVRHGNSRTRERQDKIT